MTKKRKQTPIGADFQSVPALAEPRDRSIIRKEYRMSQSLRIAADRVKDFPRLLSMGSNVKP